MSVAEYHDLTLEKDLQASIIQLAEACGWLVAHFSDSRRDVGKGKLVGDTQAAGFPDLVMARNGVLIFAELKRVGEMLRDSQMPWFYALTQAHQHNTHVRYYIWRPKDWPEIQSELATSARGRK